MTRARDIANFGDGIATADIDDGAVTAAKIGSLPAGSVLQVVRATDTTQRDTTSTNFVDASISVTITPKNSNNTILLVYTSLVIISQTDHYIGLQITDNSNNPISGAEVSEFGGMEAFAETQMTLIAQDSPATTNATTYKVRFKSFQGGTVSLRNSLTTGQLFAIEVAA